MVKVTIAGLLVVPTLWAAKVRLVTEKLTGSTPFPVRLYSCVLTAALSMKVTEPLIDPGMDGLKVTETLQVAPAPSVPPQGVVPVPTTAMSPLATKFVMFTGERLLFLTVTVFAAEAVPTSVPLKPRLRGVNVSGDVPPPEPVPEKLAICVGNEAPETARLPFPAPFEVGVKVRLIVHFALLNRVPVQVLPTAL